MDAREAKRQSARAVARKRQVEEESRLQDIRRIKGAQARGRDEYKKHLLKVRKAIREAVQEGQRSVKVHIEDTYTQDHPQTNAYYQAAQEKIEKVLESEGYTVIIYQRTNVDKPFGSDPMFTETMYWRYCVVEVSW